MIHKKRVFILTDSLGCPRKEIKINETWVDKLLNARADSEIFFTYCKPGLEAKVIDVGYIKAFEPDIMICQFGIVDACKRALSRREFKLISFFPYIRDWVHSFCKKNHYILTKYRKIHYTPLAKFREMIKTLVDSMPNTEIYFLEIAPPGPFLLDTVFGVDDDVKKYNDVLKKTCQQNVTFVSLYDNETDYLLDDGHHLNIKGNDLVYRKIMTLLKG